MSVSKAIRIFTIKYALRKQPPPTFSPDDDTDYCSVRLLKHAAKRKGALLRLSDQNSIEVLPWDGNKYTIDETSNLDEYIGDTFAAGRSYKYLTYEIEGVPAFWFDWFTFGRQRRHLSEVIEQRTFNRNARFRRQRIDLLNLMLEKQIEERSESSSSLFSEAGHTELDWFEMLYSYRAFGHPNFEREYAKFGVMLSALQETGEVKKSGDRLFVAGLGLQRTEEHFVAERRHMDTVRTNRRLVFLTLVIAGTAIAELFFD